MSFQDALDRTGKLLESAKKDLAAVTEKKKEILALVRQYRDDYWQAEKEAATEEARKAYRHAKIALGRVYDSIERL